MMMMTIIYTDHLNKIEEFSYIFTMLIDPNFAILIMIFLIKFKKCVYQSRQRYMQCSHFYLMSIPKKA